MRYQIPDEEQERLDQLNEWFTQILCSEDYFDDEKWIYFNDLVKDIPLKDRKSVV